jgi:hypothetical protein
MEEDGWKAHPRKKMSSNYIDMNHSKNALTRQDGGGWMGTWKKCS